MKYMVKHEATEAYNEMLNDCYPMVKICGYEYEPAYALKECDPIAYRCGFSDWLDSEGLTTDESEADEVAE
jgi:hypothetical protein